MHFRLHQIYVIYTRECMTLTSMFSQIKLGIRGNGGIGYTYKCINITFRTIWIILPELITLCHSDYTELKCKQSHK